MLDTFWNFAYVKVICKQRLARKRNYKIYLKLQILYDVDQCHFKKPLQSSTSILKSIYSKTVFTFFIGCSISN